MEDGFARYQAYNKCNYGRLTAILNFLEVKFSRLFYMKPQILSYTDDLAMWNGLLIKNIKVMYGR